MITETAVKSGKQIERCVISTFQIAERASGATFANGKTCCASEIERGFPRLVSATVNPPKRINALSLCVEKRWHNHPRQLPRAILNALDTHDAAELEGNDLRLLIVRHE